MKSLRIHYLQHVPFEGLGCIENWVLEKGYKLSCTKFFEGDPLPNHSTYDWLIILGGSMGVYDEKKYNWLVAEKNFIKNAIQQDKKILGICLGSQLIASALGANVYPNNEKEIGWFPIRLSEMAANPLQETTTNFSVFHWHGDTFDLPKNTINLASSEGCINQAFVYNDNVIGLQFHLEVTKKLLNQMLIFGNEELIEGKYIQSAEMVLDKTSLIGENNKRMYHLLNYFETK
jgi:GMP synthase-like glutamine amidotransferase